MNEHEEFATRNRGRAITYSNESDWYIVGYTSTSLLIGTFNQHSEQGWNLQYLDPEYEVTFIIPDKVFIKNCWFIDIDEITFKK